YVYFYQVTVRWRNDCIYNYLIKKKNRIALAYGKVEVLTRIPPSNEACVLAPIADLFLRRLDIQCKQYSNGCKVQHQIKSLTICSHNFAGDFTSAIQFCNVKFFFFFSFFFFKQIKKLYRSNDNAGKSCRGFALQLVNWTWANDDTYFNTMSDRLHLLAQSVTGKAFLLQRRCVQLHYAISAHIDKVDLYENRIFSTQCQHLQECHYPPNIATTPSIIAITHSNIATDYPNIGVYIAQIHHYDNINVDIRLHRQIFPSYNPKVGGICDIAKLTLFFLLLL
ncbi:hypothetical protein RFI_34876, partial [Reticulomyxa filosa]